MNKRVLITLFIFIARPSFGMQNEEPLFLAACTEDIDMVNQLLDAGTNVDATNKFGETVLIRAASYGDTGLVRLLLKRGANINARGDGYTALSLAAEYGHTDVIDLLLRNHADVGTRNHTGRTALHGAIDYSNRWRGPDISNTLRETAVIDQLHEEMHPVYD